MMDNETEEIYLQKLEEFIADEDKIVTVTWLSHKLNITANESRHLLNKYVKDHRVSKPDELAVIYLLSAILEDDVLSVNLLKESEVEEKTKKFKKVIEQQIYSVQKCKQVDFVPTSLIDPFDAGEIKDVPIKDAIVSKLCILRTFKVKKALPPPPAPVLKGKMSVFLNAANKTKEQPKSTDLQKAGCENTQIKKETKNVPEPKNKKNGIASFFTQSNVKPTKSKEGVKEAQREQKENMPTEVKMEPVKEEPMDVDEVKVLKRNIKTENKDRLKGLIDSDSEEDDFKPTTQPQVKENGKSEKVSRKRSKKSNKKAGPAPKRLKKTVIQRDSDSDDIFGNDESEETFREDIIENSEEESQPSQKVKILPPKNKKRKLVDKTYTDEEGFIITNKEWVEESPSEDEDKSSQTTDSPMDIPVKEEKEKKKSDNKLNKIVNNETNGKTTKGKGVKGKKVPSANQLTLMSFFKKN